VTPGEALAGWYLGAFPAVRGELGLGFAGFGPAGPQARAARREEAAERLAALEGGDALALRLARRAVREAESGPDDLLEAVLAAAIAAELRGEGLDRVLEAVPAALAEWPPAGPSDPCRLDAAGEVAALLAGLLVPVGEAPGPAREARRALEGFLERCDAARPPAEPRAPLGAHGLHDLMASELGAYLVPRELAEQAFEAMEAELRRARALAREIAPGVPLEELAGDLGEDRPETPGEIVRAYRDAQEEVLAALGEDMPPGRPGLAWRVGPPQLQGLLPLAAYRPPDLQGDGAEILLFPARGPLAAAHARSRLPLTAASLGYPGSHLLFSALPPGDLLRRLALSPHAVRGWSAYAAALAAERLGDPKVALQQALSAAQAAARAFADAALHAGLAGEGRIAEAIARPLGLPEALAQAELAELRRRPLSGIAPFWAPQAIARAVRDLCEGGRTLREAHEAILAGGGSPEEVIPS